MSEDLSVVGKEFQVPLIARIKKERWLVMVLHLAGRKETDLVATGGSGLRH